MQRSGSLMRVTYECVERRPIRYRIGYHTNNRVEARGSEPTLGQL